MNRLITEYGVKDKYAIGDRTRFKVRGTRWRHKRQHSKSVGDIKDNTSNQLKTYELHLSIDEATYLINITKCVKYVLRWSLTVYLTYRLNRMNSCRYQSISINL